MAVDIGTRSCLGLFGTGLRGHWRIRRASAPPTARRRPDGLLLWGAGLDRVEALIVSSVLPCLTVYKNLAEKPEGLSTILPPMMHTA